MKKIRLVRLNIPILFQWIKEIKQAKKSEWKKAREDAKKQARREMEVRRSLRQISIKCFYKESSSSGEKKWSKATVSLDSVRASVVFLSGLPLPLLFRLYIGSWSPL